MDTKHLIKLLLIATLFKGIISTLIVPLWEFPDEQAHFSQVSHYVEKGLKFNYLDLSEEIYYSEVIMGTLRNDRGENKYTYHPDFKPTYSTSTIGPNEVTINNLDISTRSYFVKRESARYPPLFYLTSSIGYLLTRSQNLIVRVFATRLVSVGITIASVYLTFLIGKQLFQKDRLAPIILASLVSFHPMFSFVSSGINNDNGSNLAGLAILFLSLKLLNTKLTKTWSLLASTTIGLGILIKPLIFPLIPALMIVILYEWKKSARSLKSQLTLLSPLIISAIIIAVPVFLIPLVKTGKLPYIPGDNPLSTTYNLSFSDYIKPQLQMYYRETLPWYWGVFKWLGIVLPLNVIRTIKIVMIVSFFGVVKVFFSKKPKFKKSLLATLLTFTVIYIASLTIWDYQLVKSMGFSQGIQGRYFFPTIGAHMGLILVGLIALFPKKHNLKLQKSLALFAILLHSISLYTLANAYYSLATFQTLLIQMSQYKPWFFKSPYMLIWFGLYLASLILFAEKLVKYHPHNKSKKL